MKSKCKALEKIESLVAELKLIERWDAAHWEAASRDLGEIMAFQHRRMRRSEILSQLVTLLSTLEHPDKAHK